MKFRYKFLVLLAVFVAALLFFGGNITRTFFSTAAATTELSEATLPTIAIDVNGNVINRLHGYVSNLDKMIIRETITPVTSERTFTVLIDENGNSVKKLKYEVLNDEGREVESDTFTVLDVESGPKKVKIALKETMRSGKEYIVKITLITNQSKRIYYYTRLKMYDDGKLFEKIDFVQSFKKTLISGSESSKEGLRKYLESSKSSDNSTYAYVNIKSSFAMITWGDLNPEIVWEELPTITEFYDSMATIELKYLVKVDVGTGEEYYLIKEHFRINYTSLRTYLYNYERYMEAIFDVANTSLMKDEFKLGVTNDTNAQTGSSKSQKYLGFVYGRELMLYEVETNTLNRVFSFRQNNGDYSRDLYDQHEVRLLKIHDNGNVEFMVSGYMNRGEYEGRVGIILYLYVHEDNRIEEQLYIPISSSYQLLSADMSSFAYLGDRDVFYFALYDSIYEYDLTTRRLKCIAEHVPEEKLIYCEEEAYLAWQDNPDDELAKNIYILNLADGEIHVITTSEGETVRLYGRINNNIIYGFAYQKDTQILPDGSRRLPAYKLCIEDGYGQILKTYTEAGFYIDGIEIGENIVILKRLKKTAGELVGYASAEDDSILNRLITVTKPISVTRRITDRILTEYYISMPSAVSIETLPNLKQPLNTIINYNTTIRVAEPEDKTSLYYAYSFGEVVYADKSAALAIASADEHVGTVINKAGRVIWERGVKATRSEISGIQPVKITDTLNSVQAAMKMLLMYKNLDVDTQQYDYTEMGLCDWLDSHMTSTVLDLRGTSLDEILYYIYKGRPVLAFKTAGQAVVITGYDATSVTVYEPQKGKSQKYPIKEAISMFEDAGNVFVTYVD